MVGRHDLRGWSVDAIQIILQAQKLGARVRISNRGHAVLLGPYGRTACVARQLPRSNRSRQNAEANVKRLFEEPVDN